MRDEPGVTELELEPVRRLLLDEKRIQEDDEHDMDFLAMSRMGSDITELEDADLASVGGGGE